MEDFRFSLPAIEVEAGWSGSKSRAMTMNQSVPIDEQPREDGLAMSRPKTRTGAL